MPSEDVVTDSLIPRSLSVSETFAAFMARPFGSTTVPVNEPVVRCAEAVMSPLKHTTTTKKDTMCLHIRRYLLCEAAAALPMALFLPSMRL